jgi:hypothetical protein
VKGGGIWVRRGRWGRNVKGRKERGEEDLQHQNRYSCQSGEGTWRMFLEGFWSDIEKKEF